MNEQCNTCGNFKDIGKCSYCPTFLCENCRKNHEPFCKDIQKGKKRGEGPTIMNTRQYPHRPGQETPPTTEPDRRIAKSPVLGAPYSLAEPASLPMATGKGLVEYAESMASAEPVEPVDQGLAAVKDLLG